MKNVRVLAEGARLARGSTRSNQAGTRLVLHRYRAAHLHRSAAHTRRYHAPCAPGERDRERERQRDRDRDRDRDRETETEIERYSNMWFSNIKSKTIEKYY